MALEMWFKDSSIFSCGGQLVQRSKTISTILVDGILGSIPVILFYIWTSGSGKDFI